MSSTRTPRVGRHLRPAVVLGIVGTLGFLLPGLPAVAVGGVMPGDAVSAPSTIVVSATVTDSGGGTPTPATPTPATTTAAPTASPSPSPSPSDTTTPTSTPTDGSAGKPTDDPTATVSATPTADPTDPALGIAAMNTIAFRAGSSRRVDHGTVGLNGVTFGLWDVNYSGSRAMPARAPDLTCVTQTVSGVAGICVLTRDMPMAIRYAVGPISVPPGYEAINDLNTFFEGTGYTFNIWARPGETVVVPASTRRWAFRRTNPDWPSTCGMNVALLLDSSGSISSSERASMFAAANSFVDALTGTPSRVAIWRFNGGSTQARTLTSVKSQADAAQLKAFISALPAGSGNTNWDAAFFGPALSSERYDAAILVSDGSPNASGVPTDSTAPSARFALVENAMHSANMLKDKGVKIVGVGVGIAGDEERLFEAVSSDTDYYGTSYAQLGADLTNVAMSRCSGTVTVEKQLGTSAQSAVTADSDGWQYDAQLVGGSGTLDKPADTTRAINDFGGLAQFSVGGGAWPKQLRISEPTVPGYVLEDIQCLHAGQPVGVPDLASGSILVPVDVSDAVQCTFISSLIPTPTPTPSPTPTPTPTPTPMPTPTLPSVVAPAPAPAPTPPVQTAPVPTAPVPTAGLSGASSSGTSSSGAPASTAPTTAVLGSGSAVTTTPIVAGAEDAIRPSPVATASVGAASRPVRQEPSKRTKPGGRPIDGRPGRATSLPPDASSSGVVVPVSVPAGGGANARGPALLALGVLVAGAVGLTASVARLRRR